MMLRIGSKAGFTLIEVMVAAAILALGVVLIYQGFFISIDSFNYCANYLQIAPWANEKIWQAQDSLKRLGPQAQIETSGKFVNRNKNFTWSLSYNLLDEAFGLYKIDLAVLWQEGPRKTQVTRSAYALYEQ